MKYLKEKSRYSLKEKHKRNLSVNRLRSKPENNRWKNEIDKELLILSNNKYRDNNKMSKKDSKKKLRSKRQDKEKKCSWLINDKNSKKKSAKPKNNDKISKENANSKKMNVQEWHKKKQNN